MKKRTLQGQGTTDYMIMTESELKAMWLIWYPEGSGPTHAMRQICKLIEAIAMLRGFDISKWCDD